MNIGKLIADATKSIAQSYFQLPIDGREDPIYRERVYCYELYHQLRLRWPVDVGYELSGEVDKSGHPLIRGNNLDRTKPDLLIHTPGNMDGNHAIIEVKPISASRSGIAKDLSTLTAFRRFAGYQRAIYLIYGSGNIDTVITISNELQIDDSEERLDLTLIEFWWHRRVGMPAIRVPNDLSTNH